jgi:hypothetical protein
MLKAGGVDIENLFNKAQFGEAMQPGYRRSYGGGMDYMPDPTKSLNYNLKTNQVSLLPGAAEAQGSLAGATTEAQKAAEAPYSVVEYLDANNKPKKTTLDQLKLMLGQPPASPPGKISDLSLMKKFGDQSANFDIGGRQWSQGQSPISNGVSAGLSPEEQKVAAAEKEYAVKRSGELATDMGTIQAKGFQAPAKIATLKYIGDLYDGFEGGTLSNFAMKLASTANSLNIKIDPKLPDKEAAEALAKELALGFRNPASGGGMPGSLSDSDRQFLKSMTPDLAQTNEGRKKIINANIALVQREADIAQFARNYENKYGQLNNGFFTQLSEFSKKNPVFK